MDPLTSRGIAITGTPGIGKSLFLFYLLWRIVKEEGPSKACVIFDISVTKRCYFVLTGKGCWTTENKRDLYSLELGASKHTNWYFLDAPTKTRQMDP